jgi:hypothetical protein
VLRVLGALLFCLGAFATLLTVRGSFVRPRPVAALLGLAAPVAVLAALTGALLVFIPDFFG